MNNRLNETHDPGLRSWVESANDGLTDFPIQNLPYGVFQRRENKEPARIGVGIGDQILDLDLCARAGFLGGLPPELTCACHQSALNGLMAAGPGCWALLRQRVSQLLRADAPEKGKNLAQCLVPMAKVDLCMPAAIGNYSDFYASIDHATNVGRLFRPEAPLPPNYKFLPIAYHGRASSLMVSGTPVRRPCGQIKDDKAAPVFAPSAALDYELEVGLLIGPGNALGQRIPIVRAGAQIFGVCLVNDWSARDIQKWEYQPLGPFLGKDFGTTISPWVVTMDALEPFRTAPRRRAEGDPEPLEYLLDSQDQANGAIAINLEVWLCTLRMRTAGRGRVRLSHSKLAELYWTPAQLVAHHSSNGCNLCPGDLLASGTVSGPERQNRGCLLELTQRGAEPLTLPNGETRRFLEDGDEICLRGFCEAPGRPRIGLGECTGVVLAAEGV
jgi:fumarylacetoacetase